MNFEFIEKNWNETIIMCGLEKNPDVFPVLSVILWPTFTHDTLLCCFWCTNLHRMIIPLFIACLSFVSSDRIDVRSVTRQHKFKMSIHVSKCILTRRIPAPEYTTWTLLENVLSARTWSQRGKTWPQPQTGTNDLTLRTDRLTYGKTMQIWPPILKRCCSCRTNTFIHWKKKKMPPPPPQ